MGRPWPSPRCTGTTKQGERCRHIARKGDDRCGIHRRIERLGGIPMGARVEYRGRIWSVVCHGRGGVWLMGAGGRELQANPRRLVFRVVGLVNG